MGDATPPAMSVRAYSVEDVERFLHAAAAEKARLQLALEAAEERRTAARDRLEESRQSLDAVATLVLDAELRQRRLHDETDAAIARILQAAEADAAVIVASAKADVARRALAASLPVADRTPGPPAPEGAEVINLAEHRALEVG